MVKKHLEILPSPSKCSSPLHRNPQSQVEITVKLTSCSFSAKIWWLRFLLIIPHPDAVATSPSYCADTEAGRHTGIAVSEKLSGVDMVRMATS